MPELVASEPAALPVTCLKGVGPAVAARLARLHIETVQDALFHLPLRYQDRTCLTPLGALRLFSEALITGEVVHAEVATRGRRSLLVRIADGTGFLTLRFFYFNGAQQRRFTRGAHLRCYGEVRPGRLGAEMFHPECTWLAEGEDAAPEVALTPVYPATEGVHQLTLRKLVDSALERYLPGLSEWLPPDVLDHAGMPDLQSALTVVHRPPPDEDARALTDGRHPAQARLAFEELLAHHLLLRTRRAAAARSRAMAICNMTTGDATGSELAARLTQSLPFTLTRAQTQVIGELRTDLARGQPMQRLVQGDVGSGKTLVAAAAVCDVIAAGAQAAVMAPTELLARQHARTFAHWLAPLDVEVVSLSGDMKATERRAALSRIATGQAGLAVGTHALFQSGVDFHRLALVVVDEQHRFGVSQRLSLREKGARDGLEPHQLIMSATPIPRTLAQVLHADLDLSVIDELPPGRTPVETVVVPDTRREEVVARIRTALAEGRQAYWVCPRIEAGDADDEDDVALQAAEETARTLAVALPASRVGLVHGRLKPKPKAAAMAAFHEGHTHLLVSTTVVEVGVDVPNASLMIIENAERLGLAQLHQLRGRVGRGSAKSVCVLFYRAPLSQMARRRLEVMRETTDGFRIAEADLELRGPGELFGTRQTGERAFQIADLVRDRALLGRVETAARLLEARYPAHVAPLIRRWLSGRTGLASV